jgi:hypothetical protein
VPRRTAIHTTHQVGKYLVSSSTRLDGCGRYAACVSIRSGRGSATHDRVMRFARCFDSSEKATRYATSQGLAWIDATFPHATPPSTNRD